MIAATPTTPTPTTTRNTDNTDNNNDDNNRCTSTSRLFLCYNCGEKSNKGSFPVVGEGAFPTITDTVGVGPSSSILDSIFEVADESYDDDDDTAIMERGEKQNDSCLSLRVVNPLRSLRSGSGGKDGGSGGKKRALLCAGSTKTPNNNTAVLSWLLLCHQKRNKSEPNKDDWTAVFYEDEHDENDVLPLLDTYTSRCEKVLW